MSNEKSQHWPWITSLVVAAIWIWLRDLSWLDDLENTFPVILALPMAWWLGQPWHKIKTATSANPLSLGLGIGLFVFGVLLNLTSMMALGWSLLLYQYVKSHFHSPSCQLKRLLLLPILSFPWIATDFHAIGWWFRLSGAWVSAQLFTLTGFAVERQGTWVTVEGLPVSVEAACSGLNLLQSLLIAGCALANLKLSHSPRFWLAVLLLPILAWATNTLRIFFITILALTFGVEFASGLFHTWGGLLVILLMFAICWKLFQWLEISPSSTPKPHDA